MIIIVMLNTSYYEIVTAGTGTHIQALYHYILSHLYNARECWSKTENTKRTATSVFLNRKF